MSNCPRLESDGLMRAHEDAHAELGLADLLPHATVLGVVQAHAAVLDRNLQNEIRPRLVVNLIFLHIFYSRCIPSVMMF